MGVLEMIKIRGNPFDRLKMDELRGEKIKLERRERLIIGEIREASSKQKALVQAGFGKDRSEQRVLARQIDQADKRLKLKNIQLKRLSDEVQVVDNFIFVSENKKLFEESGLMKMITKIPKNKLDDYLGQINLQDAMTRDGLDQIKGTMESEFGLVGEIEDDESTSALFGIWDTESPPSGEAAYDQWQKSKEEDETLTNS